MWWKFCLLFVGLGTWQFIKGCFTLEWSAMFNIVYAGLFFIAALMLALGHWLT